MTQDDILKRPSHLRDRYRAGTSCRVRHLPHLPETPLKLKTRKTGPWHASILCAISAIGSRSIPSRKAAFSEVMIGETDHRRGGLPRRHRPRRTSANSRASPSTATSTLKWGLFVGANALDLYKWHADVLRRPDQGEAQESGHRRAGRGRRRRRPLRRERGVAHQIRSGPISTPRATRRSSSSLELRETKASNG